VIIEHPQRAGNAVHGRLTGHQQIESNQRVRVLRRAVPVCEGCAEPGNLHRGTVDVRHDFRPFCRGHWNDGMTGHKPTCTKTFRE
jgi:hypothetical protein